MVHMVVVIMGILSSKFGSEMFGNKTCDQVKCDETVNHKDVSNNGDNPSTANLW